MRKEILAIAILVSTLHLNAQNYGFGTNNPQARVHVAGNFFVNQPFTRAALNPTAAQTKNMINGTTIGFAETDSTGRIYDPSGPRSPLFYRPYAQNIRANAFIPPAIQIATTKLEVTVEWSALGDGDSIFILSAVDENVRIGAGSASPKTLFLSGGSAYITFVSNSDLSVGEGFSIVFRRLYDQPLTTPQDASGNQLFFDAGKGALQMGYANPNFFLQQLGNNSAAFGYFTNTGNYSLAAGYRNDASGVSSFAVGRSNKATNNNSAALGTENIASGSAATAIGGNNTASGIMTLATGFNTVASGNSSATMGSGTQALSFASLSLGRNNFTSPASGTSWVPSDPAIIIGNGSSSLLRSNILEFYKNGNLLIWGSLFQFSDEKLKKDIKPLDNSLKRLAGLKGYNYTWISKDVDDRLQTGMLAQEVEKIFPELITKNQKGEMAISYEGLIPHLVEAIKELQQQVATMKTSQEKLSDIAVCICENASVDKMSAYPNPVNQQLTVTISAAEVSKGSLQLFDNNGKLVKQMSVSMQKGKNVFNLILPSLSSGQYELVANWGKGIKRQVSIVKP